MKKNTHPPVLVADSITESQIFERIAADSAQLETAPTAESSSEQPTESDSNSGELRLTADQLQAAIGAAIETALAPVTQQLTETQAQLQQVTQQKDSLEQVFKVIGKPVNFNTLASVHSDRSEGLAIDFITACESAPSRLWVNQSTGETHQQRDLSQARSLFFSDRAQLRRDMESYARKNGLIQGFAADSTTRTNIAPALLDYLSLVVRETHNGRYVWWQFPFYKLELGKGPGDSIQVARFRWLPEATTIAARTLTPGTPTVSDRQPINSGSISLQLGERGLGASSSAPPVAVPEFWTAYSMVSLENAVGSRLGRDYEVWEDISIRSRYFATSAVVYNDRSSVTTLPSWLGVNDNGTMTDAFLNNLYAYMSGLQIPPLDDGCYVLVAHDFAVAQLKNALSSRNMYMEQTQMEELLGSLQSASNREMGKVSGYVGKVCGFHVFSTNAHSMGIPGSFGVQLETLGVGATTTRSSYAFGRAAVARAIGMEAEIRRDNNDDFRRQNSWIWLSHETTGALDVHPVLGSEQQIRVVEVRTTDLPL